MGWGAYAPAQGAVSIPCVDNPTVLCRLPELFMLKAVVLWGSSILHVLKLMLYRF